MLNEDSSIIEFNTFNGVGDDIYQGSNWGGGVTEVWVTEQRDFWKMDHWTDFEK